MGHCYIVLIPIIFFYIRTCSIWAGWSGSYLFGTLWNFSLKVLVWLQYQFTYVTFCVYILSTLLCLGLFAAAHDLKVEWIVIKGVSDFAENWKSNTDAWRAFASLMAASLTFHILGDSIVFKDWPHYEGKTHRPLVTVIDTDTAKTPLMEQRYTIIISYVKRLSSKDNIFV